MRLHRPSNQAYVFLNGRDVNLGVFGTLAAQTEYDRVVAEWLANGRRLPSAGDDLTIAELALRYSEYAENYYAKTSTGEIPGIKPAMKDLVRLFGRLGVREFGPLRPDLKDRSSLTCQVLMAVEARTCCTRQRLTRWSMTG
jgi:hypothetical protein